LTQPEPLADVSVGAGVALRVRLFVHEAVHSAESLLAGGFAPVSTARGVDCHSRAGRTGCPWGPRTGGALLGGGLRYPVRLPRCGFRPARRTVQCTGPGRRAGQFTDRTGLPYGDGHLASSTCLGGGPAFGRHLFGRHRRGGSPAG